MAALGGLGAFGIWGLARRRSSQARPAPVGPKLLVRQRPNCADVGQEELARRRQTAAWLTFATLPPDCRLVLIDEFEGLASSLEARAHPLGLDVIEADPEEVLRQLSPWLLPVANAARSLLAGHWRAVDSDLCVDVVAAEAAPLRQREGRLLDPWPEREGDDEARRARFLAWPVTRAHRVDLPSASDARRVLVKLRQRVVEPDSNLALVIDSATQHRVSEFESAARIQNVCGRLDRLMRRAGEQKPAQAAVATDLFRGAATPPSPAPLAAWLPLRDTEVLVVPRLSALARRDALRQEVDRIVG